LPIRYLVAGTGPPLVLLHGAGDNALDWRWVMPDLAATHRVYAPDLPGSPESDRPAADYSSAFFERFVVGFLDALGVERTALVGNSIGGLMAMRVALSEPARVTELVLVDSAGLGRAVNPALTSVNLPGLGQAAIPLWRTPVGAYQRVRARAALLFARPRGCPARVVGGTVPIGALARLLGGPPGCAPRPSEPCGSTRGAVGPALPPKDADARLLGGTRPGVPGVPGKRSGRSPPRRFPSAHPRLRPHAPRRVPQELLGGPRRVYRGTGASLIVGDPKKPAVTLDNYGRALKPVA